MRAQKGRRMIAAVLSSIGGPELLRVEQTPAPEPADGEITVRLQAAALNHRDLFITQGRYPNVRVPAILGSDGAGECEGRRVLIDPMLGWGSDSRIWDPHASILGMPHAGTFAQYVRVPRANVHDIPSHLSFEQAAALPLAGVTAYRALFTRGDVQRGETLLITGVGGGVQTFVLQYALAAGARCIVTSGSEEKLQRARDLGAQLAINYRTDPDWHKAVRKAGLLDLVVDSAGGETFARVTALVRPGGRVVTYGGTTGDATVKMFPLFWNQIDVRGTSMGSPQDFAAMLRFVGEHRLVPIVDQVYDLEAAGEALARMQAAEQFGKIVLRIP